MRTFIATVCIAVVFAEGEKKEEKATKMLTCAKYAEAAKKACTETNKDVADEAEKKKKMDACIKVSADAVKKGVTDKKEVCTAGASALLAGAAAVATMAALF